MTEWKGTIITALSNQEPLDSKFPNFLQEGAGQSDSSGIHPMTRRGWQPHVQSRMRASPGADSKPQRSSRRRLTHPNEKIYYCRKQLQHSLFKGLDRVQNCIHRIWYLPYKICNSKSFTAHREHYAIALPVWREMPCMLLISRTLLKKKWILPQRLHSATVYSGLTQ